MPCVALIVAAGCGPGSGPLNLPDTSADNVRAFIAIVKEPDAAPSVFAVDFKDDLVLRLDATDEASIELLFYRCPLSGKGFEPGPIEVTNSGNALPETSLDFRLGQNGEWRSFAEPSELAASIRTSVVDQTGCPSYETVLQVVAPADFGWAVPLEVGPDFFSLLGTDAVVRASESGLDVTQINTPGERISGGIKTSDETVWFTTTDGQLFRGTLEGGFESIPKGHSTNASRFAEIDGEIYLHAETGFFRATSATATRLFEQDFNVFGCGCSLAVASDLDGGVLFTGPDAEELYRFDVATGTVTRESLGATSISGAVTVARNLFDTGPVVGSNNGVLAQKQGLAWQDLAQTGESTQVTALATHNGGIYVGFRFAIRYLKPNGQRCPDRHMLSNVVRQIAVVDDGLILYSVRGDSFSFDVLDTPICVENP